MDLYKQLPEFGVTLKDSTISDLETSAITTVDLLLNRSNQLMNTQVSRFCPFFLDTIEHKLNDKEDRGLPKQTQLGFERLDQLMHGGFQNGQISEIFGVGGSGKSHLIASCLALNAAKKSDDREESLVVCTEGPLETRRLVEINGETFLLKISTFYCSDLDSFDHIIFTQIPAFFEDAANQKRKLSLVVIDSIGHHLRSSDDYRSVSSHIHEKLRQQQSIIRKHLGTQGNSLFDETKSKFYKTSLSFKKRFSKAYYLMSIYAELTRLSRKFLIPIILTNQVSDFFDNHIHLDADNISETAMGYMGQVGVYSGWSIRLLKRPRRELKQHESCHFRNSRKSDLSQIQSGQQTIRDEDSPSIASLGVLWSRLAACRIRLLKCHIENLDVKNRLPTLVRPLMLALAHNFLELEPVAFEIRREGIKNPALSPYIEMSPDLQPQIQDSINERS